MALVSIDDAARHHGLALARLEEIIRDRSIPTQLDAGVTKVDDAALAAWIRVESDLTAQALRTDKAESDLANIKHFISVKSSSIDKGLAGLGILAAIAAVVVAWYQINGAANAFKAGNNYQVQADVIATLGSPGDTSGEAARSLRMLDARMESARDLYRNGGLFEASWSTMLCRVCPQIVPAKDDKTIGALIGSTVRICEADKAKWETSQCGGN